MAGKSTSRKWTDIQLAIATVSMTAVLAFWNIFAGPDQEKAAASATAEVQAKLMPPTEAPFTDISEPTMPPPGYKILFGGEAPKPRIIVQNIRRGGGAGGEGGDATTSTGSS